MNEFNDGDSPTKRLYHDAVKRAVRNLTRSRSPSHDSDAASGAISDEAEADVIPFPLSGQDRENVLRSAPPHKMRRLAQSINMPMSQTAANTVSSIQKEALGRALERTRSQNRRLQNEITLLKAHIRRQDESLRYNPDLERDYEELSGQYRELTDLVRSKENDLESVSEQLRAQEENVARLQEMMETKTSDVARLRTTCDLVKASYAELERALEDARMTIEKYDSVAKLATDERNQAISELETLKSIKPELDATRRDYAEATRRADALKRELQSAQSDLNQVRSKAEEAQKSAALEIKELKASSSLYEQRSQMQASRLVDVEAELAELREKLKVMANSSGASQQKTMHMEAELSKSRSQVRVLEDMSNELEADLKQLRKQLSQAMDERLELAQGFDREVQWRQRLEKELHRATASETDLLTELEKLASANYADKQSQSAQIEELTSKLREKEVDASSNEEERSRLQARVNELTEELGRLQTIHAEAEGRLISAVEAERAQAQAAKQELGTALQASEATDLKQRAQDADRLRILYAEVAALHERLAQERKMTRRLQDQIQDLKGNIRVIARIRPITGLEAGIDQHIPLSPLRLTSDEIILKENQATALGGARERTLRVRFDRVFGPDASNSDVCEETEYLVQSALDGLNVCIFAYGQTGSGKTFTMGGAGGVSTNALEIIMRSVASSADPTAPYSYRAYAESVEIYNEQLRDLLAPGDNKSAEKGKLSIHLSPTTRKPVLVGSTRLQLSDAAHAVATLERAVKARSMAMTAANEQSSRSHFVFTIHVERRSKELANPGDPSGLKYGTLNLVDLAGSERLSHSKTTGERLRETQAINASLSSLGNVINALLNRTGSTHVPYRSSKLTFLLQGSLSGSAKVMVLTTLSPELAYIEETKSSLRFAEKASKATLKPLT